MNEHYCTGYRTGVSSVSAPKPFYPGQTVFYPGQTVYYDGLVDHPRVFLGYSDLGEETVRYPSGPLAGRTSTCEAGTYKAAPAVTLPAVRESAIERALEALKETADEFGGVNFSAESYPITRGITAAIIDAAFAEYASDFLN